MKKCKLCKEDFESEKENVILCGKCKKDRNNYAKLSNFILEEYFKMFKSLVYVRTSGRYGFKVVANSVILGNSHKKVITSKIIMLGYLKNLRDRINYDIKLLEKDD